MKINTIKLNQKMCEKLGLSRKNFKVLKRLSNAKKIQSFLDTMPINWEHDHETYMSVERTMNTGKAHCLEAALIASLALWIHGQEPLILDLKSNNGDDHIVTLYKVGTTKNTQRWGAISKTNHATLRFRDPVYMSVRELAVSYFHEYIHTKTGEKILESYSKPFDLRKLSIKQIIDWVSGHEDLFWLADAIDMSPHNKIYPANSKKHLRHADPVELRAGNIIEWKATDAGV
jgi:hypothetical protein